MPTYRTNGAWGAGIGVNLTPAQVDENFYELRTDLDDLIANPPTPNSIESITASGFNWTIHLTDGSTLGPVAVPVVQMTWRGEWQPFTIYSQLDKFFVSGVGEFTVLEDHVSDATFDPDAIGSSPPTQLYLQTSGVGSNTTLDNLADVNASAPVAGQVLRYVGGSPDSVWQPDTLTLDDIDDVTAPTPSLGQVLTWTGSPASWQPAAVAATLDDLTDVIAPSPVVGQVLRYLGGSPDALWQPDTFTLDDLADVNVPAPGDGYVLTYQAGSPTGWIAAAPVFVPSTLDSLTDVTVPSPSDGDFLQYESGSPAGWVNAAGTAISSLATATLPLLSGDLIEVSEPVGSPPTSYISRKATIGDILTAGGFTLGSTSISLGGTTTTVAGLTLSGGTLSGGTTLPGSGQITSTGELSLGAAASALLTLGGTYTTANSAVFKMNTTLVSSVTSTQQAFNFSPVFNPSGASLGTLYGASLFDSTISGSSSLNITAYNGIASRLNEGSGYSGTVSFGRAFQALDPILNGANPITVYYHYNGNAITNGNNLASGTVTNHGFNFDGITAGSAGGTVNNYMGKLTVPSGGASAGTTNNRGLYITGNGGTASGSPPGTVNNFAIYSESTAISHFAGGLRVGTTTLLTSNVALGNGAAAATGTLTNAPAAGNPTKWIPINDNGTTRYVPAW